jgi:hypothetical protein
MRVVEFAFSALGQLSWTADKDYVLLDFAGTANQIVVLSTDPSLTAAVAMTPASSTVVQNSAILRCRTANNTHYVWNPNVKIPIEAGRTYYVAANAATRAFAYLDDIVS